MKNTTANLVGLEDTHYISHILGEHCTVGFPDKPGGQVHNALWFFGEHVASIPHCDPLKHGLMHARFSQALLGEHS